MEFSKGDKVVINGSRRVDDGTVAEVVAINSKSSSYCIKAEGHPEMMWMGAKALTKYDDNPLPTSFEWTQEIIDLMDDAEPVILIGNTEFEYGRVGWIEKGHQIKKLRLNVSSDISVNPLKGSKKRARRSYKVRPDKIMPLGMFLAEGHSEYEAKCNETWPSIRFGKQMRKYQTWLDSERVETKVEVSEPPIETKKSFLDVVKTTAKWRIA
jgi:hypothetical protein